MTDRRVADVCGVSFSFVRTVRDQLCTEQSSPQPATRVGKDGKARKTSYTKKPKPAPEPGPEEKPEVHSADESKQKVRHGKYQDWVAFYESTQRIRSECDAIGNLTIDAPHLKEAEQIADELAKLIVKTTKRARG